MLDLCLGSITTENNQDFDKSFGYGRDEQVGPACRGLLLNRNDDHNIFYVKINLTTSDPPDKSANSVATTATKTHVDCSCRCLNESVEAVWQKLLFAHNAPNSI